MISNPNIAAIEAAITPRTKAIFISYPNNPTGAVVTKEVALQLAEVVIKHDLLLLSDEIYEQLVYSDHKHVIFPNLPGLKERTIYYSGFSKSFSMTGWRLGYICAPSRTHRGHRQNPSICPHVRSHHLTTRRHGRPHRMPIPCRQNGR